MANYIFIMVFHMIIWSRDIAVIVDHVSALYYVQMFTK